MAASRSASSRDRPVRRPRFALFGAGFWSRVQLAAWREVDGADCVAIYNRTRSKAEQLAGAFDVRSVYDDPTELLRREQVDFVDIVTDVDSHAQLTLLAAQHGRSAICQKPLAPTLQLAEGMAEAHRQAGTTLLVHENWRWQTPIREVKRVLEAATIGTPFRARIDMLSGFDVFANQPFLRQLEQFILMDLGTHILDVARFLFGEFDALYAHTGRVHDDIQGEDVATIMLRTRARATVLCQLAYAGTPLEHEKFPETYVFAEGQRGSLELGPDYWLRVTTADGTLARRCPPPRYAWADPAYDVVHASIVPCLRNLLAGLQGTARAETTADDNLQTLRLVFAAYQSVRGNSVQTLRG